MSLCLKIYKLDPANFFSALRLAWQAALDLLSDLLN